MAGWSPESYNLVLWSGMLLGVVYGLVAQWSRFCLVRGLHNWWYSQNGNQLRAFTLAMAVALVGTQLLSYVAGLNMTRSVAYSASPWWVSNLVGGALFGIGMAWANACGARSLVLLGSGNLRSLMTLLVMAITAYMALSGVLASWRLQAEGLLRASVAWRSVSDVVVSVTGVSAVAARWVSTTILAALLVSFSFYSRAFRHSARDWLGGVVVGGLVVAGWYITGVLGADDFEPVRLASLSFVAPVGESLQYLMLSTGTRLSFPVVVVAGILLGSFVRAALAREFAWQGFESTRQLVRIILGACLMGVGGVLALGCTLGQGISGFSTLALSSWAALLGIVVGTRVGFMWR